MSNQVFVQQFNYVTNHYGCTPEEVDLMKAIVRKDWEGAKVCYPAMASELGFIPLDQSGAVAVEVNRQRWGR